MAGLWETISDGGQPTLMKYLFGDEAKPVVGGRSPAQTNNAISEALQGDDSSSGSLYSPEEGDNANNKTNIKKIEMAPDGQKKVEFTDGASAGDIKPIIERMYELEDKASQISDPNFIPPSVGNKQQTPVETFRPKPLPVNSRLQPDYKSLENVPGNTGVNIGEQPGPSILDKIGSFITSEKGSGMILSGLGAGLQSALQQRQVGKNIEAQAKIMEWNPYRKKQVKVDTSILNNIKDGFASGLQAGTHAVSKYLTALEKGAVAEAKEEKKITARIEKAMKSVKKDKKPKKVVANVGKKAETKPITKAIAPMIKYNANTNNISDNSNNKTNQGGNNSRNGNDNNRTNN